MSSCTVPHLSSKGFTFLQQADFLMICCLTIKIQFILFISDKLYTKIIIMQYSGIIYKYSKLLKSNYIKTTIELSRAPS